MFFFITEMWSGTTSTESIQNIQHMIKIQVLLVALVIHQLINIITTNNGPYKLLLGDGYTSNGANDVSWKYFDDIFDLKIGDEVDGNCNNVYDQLRNHQNVDYGIHH